MEAGNLWVKLGLDKNNFESGLQGAQNEAKGFKGTLQDAFSTMMGFAGFDIASSLVGGIKSAISAGIGYNASLETSSVAWSTLLGTQEKATDMLARINDFAAKTPFEKMGVDAMAKQLHNAGFEGDALFGQLTKFGDMAGAFDIQAGSLEEMVRQYAQVKQAGIAQTEDLNILQDRGIPIYKAIAEQLHINVKDVRDWASQGKISAAIYQAALDSVASSVAGGMQKQSESFTGMMSSFKDGLTQAAGLMAQDIFVGLKSSLQAAMGALDLFNSSMNQGNTAIQALGIVIQTYLGPIAGAVFNAIFGAASEAFGWIIDHQGIIQAGIVGLTSAFLAYKAATLAATIQQQIINALQLAGAISSGGLAGAQEFLTARQAEGTIAQKLLNAAMAANPIAVVILAVTALVTAIIYLWNTNEGFRTAVIGLWTTLSTTVVNAVSGMVSGIKNFFGQIPGTVSSVINSAVAFVRGINLYDIGTNMVQGLINGIKGMGSKLIGSLKDMVGDAISAAKKKLGINSPSKVFTEIGEYTSEGLAVGIQNKSGMASNAVSRMAGNLSSSISLGGASLAGATGGGYKAANITIALDGRTIARAIGQPLVNEIRVKTGLKI